MENESNGAALLIARSAVRTVIAVASNNTHKGDDDDSDDFYAHLGRELPWCPSSASFPYPNVVVLYACLALLSLVLALVAAIKYNSVKVFNRSVRTAHISNTLWIAFYIFVFLRAGTNAVRYAVDKPDEETLDSYFFFSAIILQGLTAFVLSLAVNHQRRHRSHAPPAVVPNNVVNKPPEPGELSQWTTIRKALTWVELMFFGLFIVFMAFLFVMVVKRNDDDSDIWLAIFLGMFCLQRLPILIIVLIIVFQRLPASANNDGPTRLSKFYLFLGAVFSFVNDLPLNVWALILPQDCYFYIGSLVDVVHLLYFLALIFFFLFIRGEFLRNMEECIWSTVSQVQDTFDFRRF